MFLGDCTHVLGGCRHVFQVGVDTCFGGCTHVLGGCRHVFSGFPLFWTDKIPYFHDFSRFFGKFLGIFSLFLKYDFQVVLNINMQTY